MGNEPAVEKMALACCGAGLRAVTVLKLRHYHTIHAQRLCSLATSGHVPTLSIQLTMSCLRTESCLPLQFSLHFFLQSARVAPSLLYGSTILCWTVPAFLDGLCLLLSAMSACGHRACGFSHHPHLLSSSKSTASPQTITSPDSLDFLTLVPEATLSCLQRAAVTLLNESHVLPLQPQNLLR